jgi:hypothetical protein
MKTTPTSEMSIPSFGKYVEDRKVLKSVSPKTFSWFAGAWKAFGPYLDPVLASRGRLNDGLRAAISARPEKVRPISVNSYLTCVGAFLSAL